MTTSLTSKVNISVSGTYSGSPALGNVAYGLIQNYSNSFNQGVGINQADKIYATTVTVSASSSTTLDFYTGLTDALGASLAMTGIKAMIICPSSTNVNDVVIGDAASNQLLQDMFDAATDTITVKPGGMFLISNPTTEGYVVDATHCNLKLANSSSGTSVVMDVIVVGI